MKIYVKYIIRLLTVISALAGLYVQLVVEGLYKLNFYTIWSNIAVLIFFSYLFVKKPEEDRGILRVKAGITIAILLTFIVYNVLLLPTVTAKEFNTVQNYTLHYIVPILCVLDWILYDKVGYDLIDPIYWTAFPLFYAVFALIRGIVYPINIPGEDSPFPYFFVDITKIGIAGVAGYVCVICALYVLMGYGMLLLKRRNQ